MPDEMYAVPSESSKEGRGHMHGQCVRQYGEAGGRQQPAVRGRGLAAWDRWWPWAAMVLIFVAGLVLPVWWLAAPHPAGVAGLGAYPSAYLGDTVLLPTGCAVLLAGSRRLPPARWEWLVTATGVALAAVIAVIVQAEWLEDPTTQRNWTLPETGQLNAAGWWHAAYFTGMSGVLVGLTVLFLVRARAARRAGQPAAAAVASGRGAALVLTAWVSYAALAVHDDFSGPGFSGTVSRSAATGIALVGLVFLLAGALVWLAYGRLAAVLARPALAALGAATLIVSLVTAPRLTGLAISVPVAAVCITVAAATRDRAAGRDRPHARAGR